MPRIRPYTRADTLRKILFERTKVRIPNTEIARVVGKSKGTITNWKNDPEKIPLPAAIAIMQATGATKEDWAQLFEIRY